MKTTAKLKPNLAALNDNNWKPRPKTKTSTTNIRTLQLKSLDPGSENMDLKSKPKRRAAMSDWLERPLRKSKAA